MTYRFSTIVPLGELALQSEPVPADFIPAAGDTVSVPMLGDCIVRGRVAVFALFLEKDRHRDPRATLGLVDMPIVLVEILKPEGATPFSEPTT